jgi:hypothetical protein
VTGRTSLAEIPFPWLPGEAQRLPDPAWTYRDDPAPPQYLMVALTMLARAHRPQDEAPVDWLACLSENTCNLPIRAFARERFGLTDVWNETRQSYEWYDTEAKNPDGTLVSVTREEALQRCWSGYSQLLLDELHEAGETPAEALERIPDQWRQWTDARASHFVAKWRDAAAWPPALALSWIMFEGDWRRISAYLGNGRDIPNAGIFLSCIGSFLDDEPAGPANRRAAQDLMHASRLRLDHPKRVVVRGRLNGEGALVEIGPAELSSLEWALDPHQELGAVLERYGGDSYSGVVVDADTLVRAFPAMAENGNRSGEEVERLGDWAALAQSELIPEQFWKYPVAFSFAAFGTPEAMWAAHIHTPLSSKPEEMIRTIVEKMVASGLARPTPRLDQPLEILMHALRSGRALAWGKLQGVGAPIPIPAEQWGADGGLRPNHNGLLQSQDGFVCSDRAAAPTLWYTNVCFEAGSVRALFRPAPLAKRRGRKPGVGAEAETQIMAMRNEGVNVDAMGEKKLARELSARGVKISPRQAGRKKKGA